ncbi:MULTISPECIES: RHS repeat-associated core domain-containing protein, partial [Bacteroidales]
LAKVIRPDKREVEFTYDALGRRLSKSFGTTVTRWVWNGNVPLHQWKERREYSVMEDRWNTAPERRDMTVWLFDEDSFVPSAMIRGGKAYSILTDQLGTPTEAYDSDGNEVWSRVLDMDGNVIEETGNRGMIPFLFQGQYYDPETGLAYNRFRYYDPKTGAYISQDSIGLAGGNPTLYGYVDDPNTWIDVFGLHVHHICTNKNEEWSDKFRELFRKYGLGKFKNGNERKDVLNDPLNKVYVPGHKGPHSEEGFHSEIYDRLKQAGEIGGEEGFREELAKMKIECVTPGTKMNDTITKKKRI